MRRACAAVVLIGCGPVIWEGDVPAGWSPDARPDVEATVTDPDGVPLADAWVTLSPSGRDALADASGEAFLVGVPEGAYTVVVAAPGYDTLEDTLVVTDDGAVVTFVLDPVDTSATLSGRVRDAAGSPVLGARVVLDGAEIATTDLDGQFEVGGLDAGRHSLLVDASGKPAGSWSTEVLDLSAGVDVGVDVRLPGAIRGNNEPIGSTVCAVCHSAEAAAWSKTTHAQTGRTPDQLAGHPIAAAFAGGLTVSLAPALPAASAILDDTGEGWQITLQDTEDVRTFDIVEVYGGHGPGAAFVALDGDHRVLLPLAWAAAGEGNGDVDAGFVPAWTEAWASGNGIDPSPDSTQTSFDLHCGGCHTTGGGLVQSGDEYSFEAIADAPVESVVGCEACHGDGGLHRRVSTGRVVNIVNPALMEGRRQVEVCARCHGNASSADHPFSDDPGWPATSEGRLPQPDERDAWVWDRDTFAAVPASKVIADQAGELLASPHHQGPLGYVGSCSDCHVAHGSEHPTDLRVDPLDPTLCTDCHRDLQGVAAQREHTHHKNFQPGLWSPGNCVTCHMARTAPVVRRDPLSGVGEQRAHTIAVFDPTDILADFDAAGTDQLGPGQVAVNACMDCHIQAAQDFADVGLGFPGPLGDPYYRVTYVNLAVIQARLWGTP